MMRIILVLCMLTTTTLLASCQNATKSSSDGMQAIAEARMARESLPGRAHYQLACATCHEGAVKKAPHREMLGLMPPETILSALTNGLMKIEASTLTQQQKAEVAEYLAGSKLGASSISKIPACDVSVDLDFSRPAVTQNWGLQPNNTRHISRAIAGISAEQVARLEPKWALNFPAANRARSQPTLAGGLLFTGSHNGAVYALDQQTGCQVWAYQASGEVRTGIVLDAWASNWESSAESTAPLLYFGDVLGHVYALDAATGKEVWRDRADEHPNATITGTPSLHNGSLYVPVSALEVSLAVDPNYECCTFRGSVVAYTATTGERQWQTYTIDEIPTVQSQNSAGTNMRGSSGAVIWNSPAIDAQRNQLTIGTGENMSSPASLTSDAIMAMDLTTGEINWSFQATANDVWNTACDTSTPQSCPPENGPDFDFGAATILANISDGQSLVVGGQKSGVVHALNPDTGALVWQTKVGRGGIQGGVHFGMAAAGDVLYVPISDMADGRAYDSAAKPGIHALDMRTGELLWYSPSPDVCNGRAFCHPGNSQAITVANGMVFAGGMDGVMRIHDAATGQVLKSIDTTQNYPAITGQSATGGSLGGAAGAVVQDGLVVLTSGYGLYNHMPGNLLLVLEVSDR